MVESEELIVDIAKNLKKLNVSFMRVELLNLFLFHIEMQNILKLVNKVFSFLELLRKKQVFQLLQN